MQQVPLPLPPVTSILQPLNTSHSIQSLAPNGELVASHAPVASTAAQSTTLFRRHWVQLTLQTAVRRK